MPTTYGNDIVYCLKAHCGVRGYCRQKWGFKFKLSANSVMRGRVNAIRTFKGLVADLKIYKYFNVSSTNSEQCKLCINGPLYINARLLWK
ncbi:hypothetical protein HMPREF9944_01803 [Segatella maculosa OT 289]|uniref:Uncharacterized protein n=1 Tax=Segatella maculosa OT 289 TaxID=999422 RepID=H1HNQ9_9BACT|nr:hypothetical protein HMPREF9944_01803 [Segatella maculosa OT 289]